MPSEQKPVLILEDSPAIRDEFGSHQNIADAILQLVGKEPGGKAIALTGDWGSGKSTVVGLLAKSSKTTPGLDLEVFVFDAWAHEGDPLRRSFLERLIKALQERGWVDKTYWDGKLSELSKHRRVISSSTSPVLTKPGIVMLIFLYLVPVGLVLISGSHGFYYKRTIFVIGLILYGLPLFVSMFHWFSRSRAEKTKTRFDLLGLLANKTVQQTETETMESPDPTSVEFQQMFRQLTAEALNPPEQPNRKLLVIVDNLDRVATTDALRLWASMTTFLDFTSSPSSMASKQIWTLVPFDEKAIKQLWEGERARDHSLGETFLAKTFQIRFRVPAPVLSDWTAFLRTQLQTAFPQHEDRELYNISRIFFILRTRDQSPTPREIKTFVNQVGASYRSYPESMPLTMHSIFAALTSSGKEWNPQQEVPSAKELEPYVGPDWAAGLAALYYHVPKDKALQVLFGLEVERLLTEGDSEKLKILGEKPGLDQVVLQVIDQKLPTWLPNEPFRIGRAAIACTGVSNQTTLPWEEVWTRLDNGARKAKMWQFLDQLSGAGLGVLIERRKENDFTMGLLESISQTGLAGSTTETRGIWVNGLSAIIRSTLNNGQESLLSKYLRIDNSAEDYLKTLESSRWLARAPEVGRFFRPGCNVDSVIELLRKFASLNEFRNVETALEVMLNVPDTWDWNSFLQTVQSRLHQQNVESPEVGAFVRSLLRLDRKDTYARGMLHTSIQNGWLFQHLQISHNGNHYESTASCLLAIILFEPECNGSSNPLNALQGRNTYRSYLGSPRQTDAVFRALVSQVDELVSIEELLEKERTTTLPRTAICEILKELSIGPRAQEIFSAELIEANYQALISALEPQSFKNLFAATIDSGRLVEILTKKPFALESVTLYRAAMDAAPNPDLQEHIAKGLRSLNKESWLQSLRNGSELLTLLVELDNSGASLELEFPFRDALSALADDAISGSKPAHVTPDLCEKLVKALTSEEREIFKRHLADSAAGTSSNIVVFLGFFAHALDCNYLSEVADKLVRESFAKIVDRLDPTELSWVNKVLKECPHIRSEAKTSSRKTLRARLKRKLEEDPSNELTATLQAILDNINGEDDKDSS